MQIFVKTLTGKTITIQCENTDTIGDAKLKIRELEWIEVGDQKLVLSGIELIDDLTFAQYNIGSQSTIHLVVKMRNGDFIQ